MKHLVESIINKNYDDSENHLAEAFRSIMERKMYEMKKQIAAKMCEQSGYSDTSRLGGGRPPTQAEIQSGVGSLANQMGFQGSSSNEVIDSVTRGGKTTTTTTRWGSQTNPPSSGSSGPTAPAALAPTGNTGKLQGVPGYSDTERLKKFEEQNTHNERMKRLRADVIEEEENDNETPVTSRPGGIKIGGRVSIPDQQAFPTNPDYVNRMNNVADVVSVATGIGPGRIKTATTLGKLAFKHGAPNELNEQDDAAEESSMARSELQAISKDVKTIMSKIKKDRELEAWTQSKITKAADYMNAVADYMENEEEPLDEGRINIVKVRIRGGKIQRRKKVSNVSGFTMRGGKLTRMSATERRRRKLGAKKAARKSKAKKTQMLRKRRMALMKRQRLGL